MTNGVSIRDLPLCWAILSASFLRENIKDFEGAKLAWQKKYGMIQRVHITETSFIIAGLEGRLGELNELIYWLIEKQLLDASPWSTDELNNRCFELLATAAGPFKMDELYCNAAWDICKDKFEGRGRIIARDDMRSLVPGATIEHWSVSG